MSNANLPAGWRLCTLGEVRADRSARVSPSQSPDEIFELFSIPSFPSGAAEIVPGAAIGSDKQSVEPGTVLVSKINPRINRVWHVRPRTTHRLIASTEWVPFFPVDAVAPQYLAHYLCQDAFRDYLAANASGVGGSLTRVRPAVVDRYPLYLPPLDEQLRIAAALDEHLSDIADAMANLRRARSNATRFAASVMQAARGGFDPADPPDVPWRRVRIGDVWRVTVGATPRRSNAAYWNGDIPWVSSGEVAFRRIRSTRESISALGLAECSTKLCAPGTVLIGMIGEGRTRGQVAILDVAACTNQNAAAIHVSETEHSSEFLYYALAAQYEETRRVGGGNNQKALNKQRVQTIEILLPEPGTQRAVVNEIERRLAVSDRVSADIDVQLARANRLRQSILTRAFAGQLVKRDGRHASVSALFPLAATGEGAEVPGLRARGPRTR